jgi:hypothetical protein
MATYRILSIDGGGVRGLLVSVLLEQLDERAPGWRNEIDLIAGTSTGGIVALALAKGLEPQVLRKLYYEKSPDIFDSAWYELREGPPLVRADHSNRHLRTELEAVFGATRLRDLKKKVLIASFDLHDEKQHHWKPKFFHNFSGKDTDGNMRAVDVAMYTTAAPTYFPTVDGFIDGGVVANNPAMAAIAQTQDTRARIKDRPAIEDIRLFSIGTGFLPRLVDGDNHDWGYAQWIGHLVHIMFDGLSGVPDYQCRQMLGEHYHRLDHEFAEEIDIDEWRARDELVRIGEIEMKPALDDAARWLQKQW